MNLKELTIEELNTLSKDIGVELQKRFAADRAKQELDRIVSNFQKTLDRTPGDPWKMPIGPLDAYQTGNTVTHSDTVWTSLLDNNVWEPGVSGWREDPAEGEEYPEYLQPTGAHDAYNTGDRITFEGVVFESLINGNVWSPATSPTSWKEVALPEVEEV